MKLVYCGTIAIDEEFQLRKADEDFLHFSGQKVFCTVKDFIHQDDFDFLQSALNDIWEGKCTDNVVAVRKQGETDSELLVIKLKKDAFDLGEVRPVYMEFYTVEQAELLSEEHSRRDIEAYEAFFGMLSGIMLLYDSESGILDIRAGISEQTLALYHGTLSDWEEKHMPGRLEKGSEAEFDSLCKNIRKGTPAFQHSIVTNAFGQEDNMQLFSFRCRSMQRGAFFWVVGVIAVPGENKAESGITAYTMDAGLPILSKKSIISYAKRTFLTNQESTYLVIMDLDDFKVINDTYGHLFGDKVLLKMVEIVKNDIGKRGMLGRIGGDELMIVINSIESETELRNMLRSIRTDIEWAFKREKEGLHLTCSMGVATYPDNADTYDEVFQLADRMLYLAKNKGKNRYVIYKPEIHAVNNKITGSDWNKKVNTLKEDKLGVMQRLVEEFLIRRITTLEAEIREVVACFELDELSMVIDDGASVVMLNENGYYNGANPGIYCDYDPGFLEGFDENNLFLVDGLFHIETKAPKLAKHLASRGIESALIYRMVKNGRMFGYVMFARKSRRQRWAEYEKIMLGVVGKAIELTYSGK